MGQRIPFRKLTITADDEKNPQLADTRCPACDHQLDAATGVGPDAKVPHDGSVTVCLYCRLICRFEEVEGKLLLVRLTAEEWIDMPVDQRSFINKIRAGIKLYVGDRFARRHAARQAKKKSRPLH